MSSPVNFRLEGKNQKTENQPHHPPANKRSSEPKQSIQQPKPNQVSTVLLYGIPIVCLFIENQERLCLAQISNTLLKQFSYNEIHNRRVALGITCVQCTPVQLEILRRAGAMPVSSRRCGMITRREAERLCKSFLGDNAPPRLPDDFAFSVFHECAWGCRGSFLPARYNSSRAKCIKCSYCGLFFSPNKFIFHSHRLGPNDKYVQPDAANFNSWRRHMKLIGSPPDEITHAWEDVKAMFNGGTRKRMISSPSRPHVPQSPKKVKEDPATAPAQYPIRPVIHPPTSPPSAARIANFPSDLSLPFPRWMDYMWHAQKPNSFQFAPYALPWLKRPLNFGADASPSAGSTAPAEQKPLQTYNHSAFKPVKGMPTATSTTTTYISDDDGLSGEEGSEHKEPIKESISSDDEMVDIETTEDDIVVDGGKKIIEIGRQTPHNTNSPDVREEVDWRKESSPIIKLPSPTVISAPTSIDLVIDRSSSPQPVIPNNNNNNSVVVTPAGSGNGELWSVARLSLDRPASENHHHHHHHRPPVAGGGLPFYHRNSDLSKHFHTFGRHAEAPHPHTIV